MMPCQFRCCGCSYPGLETKDTPSNNLILLRCMVFIVVCLMAVIEGNAIVMCDVSSLLTDDPSQCMFFSNKINVTTLIPVLASGRFISFHDTRFYFP